MPAWPTHAYYALQPCMQCIVVANVIVMRCFSPAQGARTYADDELQPPALGAPAASSARLQARVRLLHQHELLPPRRVLVGVVPAPSSSLSLPSLRAAVLMCLSGRKRAVLDADLTVPEP